MDLTPIFKSCIKKLRENNDNILPQNKHRILKKHKKDKFSKQIKDICQQISLLKNLLVENRAAYMKFACHLKNSPQMTDEQRDLIDNESEKIIKFYNSYLNQFKSEWDQEPINKQYRKHSEGVFQLLKVYLENVEQLHLQQRKYRIEHELQTYKFLKLESDKKQIPIRLSSGKTDDRMSVQDNWDTNEISEIQNIQSIKTRKVALDDDNQKTQLINEEDDGNSEDVQVLESENTQLYQELQGLSEEVEQIEKNVVDIAKLQELFTEKVVKQKFDIEWISNTVAGATENIKDANEQIQQAIQRNAGLRVWALFFLLVMSFALLFLDWYND